MNSSVVTGILLSLVVSMLAVEAVGPRGGRNDVSCGNQCGGRSGPCAFCGPTGLCCRKGFNGSLARLKAKMMAFYAKHNPQKLHNVDRLLTESVRLGENEQDLSNALEKRYGEGLEGFEPEQSMSESICALDQGCEGYHCCVADRSSAQAMKAVQEAAARDAAKLKAAQEARDAARLKAAQRDAARLKAAQEAMPTVAARLKAAQEAAAEAARVKAEEEEATSAAQLFPIISANRPQLALLFIGNSYTYYNQLDQLVCAMASETGRWQSVHCDSVAAGGYRLAQHEADSRNPSSELAKKLESRQWDAVIFQEQSQIPSFPPNQPQHVEFLRAVKDLQARVAMLSTSCRDVQCREAQPVLLMTWAHQNGDKHNPQVSPDFRTMQQRVAEGYTRAAQLTVPLPVIPVGTGWQNTQNRHASEDFGALYASDGNHPSLVGSCLSAGITMRYLTGERVRLAACLKGDNWLNSARSASLLALATRLEADIAALEVKKCAE